MPCATNVLFLSFSLLPSLFSFLCFCLSLFSFPLLSFLFSFLSPFLSLLSSPSLPLLLCTPLSSASLILVLSCLLPLRHHSVSVLFLFLSLLSSFPTPFCIPRPFLSCLLPLLHHSVSLILFTFVFLFPFLSLFLPLSIPFLPFMRFFTFLGVSLSEPHTSVNSLPRVYVCLLGPATYHKFQMNELKYFTKIKSSCQRVAAQMIVKGYCQTVSVASAWSGSEDN